MRFVRVAALAASASLTLFTMTANAAPSCWYPNEAKAAQLRDFHAMLMVGTLQCRTSNKFAIERYNDFVSTQRGLLDSNSNILKAHFLREHGIQEGQGAYDRYATSLANGQSARASDPGYCSTIDTFIRMATAASQADLLVLAQSMSTAPQSGACPPTNYTEATPENAGSSQAPKVVVAPDTPAEAPAAAVAAADAGPAPATPEVKAAAGEPATETAAAVVAPAAETAKAEPAKAAATAPATSREDALQAAVVALQSAAAALQAASASTAPAAAASDEKPVQTVSAVKVEDAPVVPPKEEPKP